MAKYDDYGHGDSDGNYNDKSGRDKNDNEKPSSASNTDSGLGGANSSLRDLRYFEHGYDAPEGSDLGSMRDKKYRDSLARSFDLGQWDDKTASSLDAELTNSDWFDRVGNYGLIDAISGRSTASQMLSRALDFGLSFTPFGKLASLGDFALSAFNNGFSKNTLRKGLNVGTGMISDPMMRNMARIGGLAALGDTRGATRQLGGFVGGLIGNELLPGIGGQLGSLGGSYLSNRYLNDSSPSFGSGFGSRDHDSRELASQLGSSASRLSSAPTSGYTQTTTRSGQNASDTDWNQVFSQAAQQSPISRSGGTDLLGGDDATGKAKDFNSYGVSGGTTYSSL